MPNDHLILDLDGTLSDPSVGLLRSINYALTNFSYPAVSPAEISAYIGPPIDVTFRRLSQSTSEGHVLALVAKFRERYADIGYAENTLYPGIVDALDGLFQRGVRLGLCTSKRVDIAEKVLTMFGLREYFAFVSGGDVGVSKAVQLSAILADRLAGPGSTMIGDRAFDVVAGKANSLRTIGVLWGHGSEAELVDAGADRVLAEPMELDQLTGP
jgi:phosphoglycolate phosphatase